MSSLSSSALSDLCHGNFLYYSASIVIQSLLEPHHENTCFSAFCICENKGTDQLRGNHAADQCHCFCFMDKSSSVVEQPGLCQTWLETPKAGFLMMQLILSL